MTTHVACLRRPQTAAIFHILFYFTRVQYLNICNTTGITTNN